MQPHDRWLAVVDLYPFIRDLCGVIARVAEPQAVLEGVVELFATRLRFDGCAITLFGDREGSPVSEVSGGASGRTVRSTGCPPRGRLAAEVRQRKTPVLFTNLFFASETGKGGQNAAGPPVTAAGVPLEVNREIIGVLAFHAGGRTQIGEADLPALAALANHAVAALDYAGILQQLGVARGDDPGSPGRAPTGRARSSHRRPLLAGTPVSPGLSAGRARFLGSRTPSNPTRDGQAANPASELERFRRALLLTREEILTLMEKARLVGLQDSSILDAFLMILDDSSFWDQMGGLLHEGESVERALKKILAEYLSAFRTPNDPTFQDRRTDLEDLGDRVLRNLLAGETTMPCNLDEDTVLVARELSALDILSLRHDRLKAVVLSGGALTSHSSILARSFEIPMLIGVGNLLATVRDGDPLIVDADAGLVFCRPSRPLQEAYRRLETRAAKRIEVLESLRGLKTETRDGYQVRLGANIGLPSDLEAVRKYGADCVGLYRTELTFLARPDLPSEEEQFDVYRQVLDGAVDRFVTFRTLDLGGDKFLPLLGVPREENPQLGWRSIRVSLELDEIFRTQLRAILRASVFGRARILLPMITSVEEMTRSVSILQEEKTLLARQGIPHDGGIKLGVMVEVPGTVKILTPLLRYSDFASIGTNDLIQYTLAVDRGNLKVASLYNPFHPAVISTIHEAVLACRKAGKEVTICGESASLPASAFLYLAMQADCLSMNPAAIPLVKMVIRQSALVCARVVLKRVLEMETAAEIEAYVESVLPSLPLNEPPV